MKNLLESLTRPIGVSGYESEIRERINEYRPEGFTSRVDAVGNLIWAKTGGSPKVVFTAHMDEIGLMVSGYRDGKLEIATIGGFDPRSLPNHVVTLANGKKGVIGLPAPHVSKDRDRVIPIDELLIDIGAGDDDEAKELAPIGTVGVIDCESFMLNDHEYVGRNTDNRSGVTILVAIANYLVDRDDVAFIFTVREEVGLMGAKGVQESALFDAEYINVDVTTAGTLGSGCLVSVKDGGYMASEDMLKKFKEIGAENFEVGKGGTSDHAALQYFRKACGISLPSAYIHSHVSKVSIDDMADAARLCIKYVETY